MRPPPGKRGTSLAQVPARYYEGTHAPDYRMHLHGPSEGIEPIRHGGHQVWFMHKEVVKSGCSSYPVKVAV